MLFEIMGCFHVCQLQIRLLNIYVLIFVWSDVFVSFKIFIFIFLFLGFLLRQRHPVVLAGLELDV